MGFPDLIWECAFSLDYAEGEYAGSGWTDISRWIISASGTLRGRAYEVGRCETGDLKIELENTDNRFTPGKLESPYYPDLKSNRRLRVRGKNMLPKNVGRTGGQDHSTQDFITLDQSIAIDRVSWSGTASHRADEASWAYDGSSFTLWTTGTAQVNGQYYILDLSVSRAFNGITLDSGGTAGADWPKGYSVYVSANGSDWGSPIATGTGDQRYTEISFTTQNARYIKIVQTGSSTYWWSIANIVVTQPLSSSSVLAPVLATHDPETLGLPTELEDELYHIEATVAAGAPAGEHHLLCWYAPVELGVRLMHSGWIWQTSGGTVDGIGQLVIRYFDKDWEPCGTSGPCSTTVTLGSSTPTRYALSHLPPAETKYAVASIAVRLATALTANLTLAVVGLQAELPANLAPNISGIDGLAGYEVVGTGTMQTINPTNPATCAAKLSWASGDKELRYRQDRLVPGETYTLACEVSKEGGGPNILVTADDGQSGTTVSTETGFVDVTLAFTASRVLNPIKFIPASAVSAGHTLSIRKMRIVGSDQTPGKAGSALDTTTTAWARPTPIFEGWIPLWPSVLGSSTGTVTISAQDRRKRLGEVQLPTVVAEILMRDTPEIFIPLSDSPVDSQDQVSIMGQWSEDSAKTTITITAMRRDMTGTSYALGTEGPGDDTALSLVANGHAGYVLPVPCTKDYWFQQVAPPSTFGPLPPAMPPPPDQTEYMRVYHCTWTQTYNGDGSQYASPYVFEGYAANLKSQFGFNWQAIQADLAGMTILAVWLNMRNVGWYNKYAKGSAWFGTHTNSSKPSTWSNALPQRFSTSGWGYGNIHGIVLGPEIGSEFQRGVTKGIVLGPTGSDTYTWGQFDGVTHPDAPRLYFIFKK